MLPAAAAGKAKAETAPDEDGDEADTRAALGGSYELREYRDGDTLKQVHWKLSAKLDRLMVREPLTALRAALTPGGDLDGAEEWGDFPQQAAKHRKNPPKRKKECTALSRRGAADPGSGLKFVDRVLVSTQRPAAHPALWLAADAALLLALTFGCCWCFPPGSALRCRCGCGPRQPLSAPGGRCSCVRRKPCAAGGCWRG